MDTYTEHNSNNPINQPDPETLNAACLNEAIDNYIETPSSSALEELRYYQEVQASALRELRTQIEGMESGWKTILKRILNKIN